MTEPSRNVVAHPAAMETTRVITITEETLNEGLKKAAERARKEERASQTKVRDAALEAQAEAHVGELARVAAETTRSEAAAHAHGFHKAAWVFGLPAFVLGAAGGIVGVLYSQNAAYDAGQRGTRENVLTGAMIERMRGESDGPPQAPEE